MTTPDPDPTPDSAVPVASTLQTSASTVTPQHNLAVALGAIIGVFARFTVGELARLYLPLSFPIGTLLVNLSGCLLIGIVQTLWLDLRILRCETQMFAAVGVLGGFTTFSSFSVETVHLLETGAIGQAVGYQVCSLLAGVAAVALGSIGARALCHPSRSRRRRHM